MIRFCLFDLDGTLLNTIEDLADCTNKALKANHLPQHPISAYYHFVGHGMKALILNAANLSTADDPLFKAVMQNFMENYEKYHQKHTAPYPHIFKLLNSLLQMNIKLGILSNKADNFVKEITRAFFSDLYFSFILGQKENLPMKPDPAGIHMVLKKYCLQTTELLYIGDSDVDIITAKSAHVLSVGAAWGFRGEKELAEAKADFIVNDPLDIIQIIKELNNETTE